MMLRGFDLIATQGGCAVELVCPCTIHHCFLPDNGHFALCASESVVVHTLSLAGNLDSAFLVPRGCDQVVCIA